MRIVNEPRRTLDTAHSVLIMYLWWDHPIMSLVSAANLGVKATWSSSSISLAPHLWSRWTGSSSHAWATALTLIVRLVVGHYVYVHSIRPLPILSSFQPSEALDIDYSEISRLPFLFTPSDPPFSRLQMSLHVKGMPIVCGGHDRHILTRSFFQLLRMPGLQKYVSCDIPCSSSSHVKVVDRKCRIVVGLCVRNPCPEFFVFSFDADFH